MTKQAIRILYKQKRIAISPKEKSRLDDLMLIQLQQLGFEGLHTLLTYWPIDSMGEPNTHLFTNYLRHMVPNLQIAYPVSHLQSRKLHAVLIDENTVYQTNQWGITEPKTGNILDSSEIDVAFVPLLAFDTQGYRVGYGKGFYDQFLSNCTQNISTIGFSYFEPVDEIADIENFDIPLNFCITPQKVYEF